MIIRWKKDVKTWWLARAVLFALVALAFVAAPARAVSNPYAGVNFTLPAGSDINGKAWQSGMNVARDAGFTGIRLSVVWSQVETSEGQYDFSAYDPILFQAKTLGLDVTVVTRGDNPLYKNQDMALSFARYAARLADHYRGLVGSYELFERINEGVATIPGLSVSAPVAQSYSRTFFLALQAIKMFDPNAKVLVGAMPIDDTVFTETLRQRGVFSVADGVSVLLTYDVSGYDSPDTYRKVSDGVADLRELIGPRKQLTVGRVVLTGHFAMPEARATALTRLAVQLPALGVDRFFYDKYWDDSETEFEGFVSPAGLPRPALTWMKILDAQLEGMKPVAPPFSYRLLFPRSLLGYSQEFFYQNGGLLACVFWVEGTADRGMMEANRPYFTPFGIYDINGYNVGDYKFQPTQEGWMLTNVPAQAYPQVIQMRSLDLDQIFPPPPNPANAPLNLNAPTGAGGSPSPLP